MEEQDVNNQRTTFLTVLCILTFIGSGLAVLLNLLGLLGIGALNSILATYGGQASDTSGLNSLLMVIFNAASLYGAIMMWNLKKVGFYLYVVAQALMVAFVFTWGGLFFAVLFVVLYALNFKHLK